MIRHPTLFAVTPRKVDPFGPGEGQSEPGPNWPGTAASAAHGGESDVFDGYRVLELGTWLMVPAATTVLADFGADVIKVEQPGTGDPVRRSTLAAPRRGQPAAGAGQPRQAEHRPRPVAVLEAPRSSTGWRPRATSSSPTCCRRRGANWVSTSMTSAGTIPTSSTYGAAGSAPGAVRPTSRGSTSGCSGLGPASRARSARVQASIARCRPDLGSATGPRP